MAEITVGDVVRVNATFTVDASDTDPTAIVLKVKPPNGQTVRYVSGVGAFITNSATGVYRADIIVDVEGVWQFEWEGTGTVRATRGSSFVVVFQGTNL